MEIQSAIGHPVHGFIAILVMENYSECKVPDGIFRFCSLITLLSHTLQPSEELRPISWYFRYVQTNIFSSVYLPKCETNIFALPAVKMKPLFWYMTQNETSDLPSLHKLEGHGRSTAPLPF